jgi:SAM-dependent methyltransferase
VSGPLVCRDASLLAIAHALRSNPARELIALDPDHAPGHYAGELVDGWIHRPYRVWLDLAERLGLRLLTPRTMPGEPPRVVIRFAPLDAKARLKATADDPTERYGTDSPFARTSKHEDPGFVLDFVDAVGRVGLVDGARVLDLGCNSGAELLLLRSLTSARLELVGIDHSASAIAAAREALGFDATLHCADLNALVGLGLGRFDLVISFGTLQSPGIDDRELVRRVVQDNLAPRGAVIFAYPNCRYVDGEIEYGARMLNFTQPELGLLVKDVAFYRKYLQQHDRQVFVTGKHYLFVTAVTVRGE